MKQKLLRVSRRFLVIGRQLYLNFKKKRQTRVRKTDESVIRRKENSFVFRKAKVYFFQREKKV